jgi:hypothetical protein
MGTPERRNKALPSCWACVYWVLRFRPGAILPRAVLGETDVEVVRIRQPCAVSPISEIAEIPHLGGGSAVEHPVRADEGSVDRSIAEGFVVPDPVGEVIIFGPGQEESVERLFRCVEGVVDLVREGGGSVFGAGWIHTRVGRVHDRRRRARSDGIQ